MITRSPTRITPALIFSNPATRLQGRRVTHEFHALDAEKLLVSRPNALNAWKPQAGLARKELPDAAPPAAASGTRLLQMRRLAQEFTGHGLDKEGKRWELRLLPAPLYRYPAAPTGVVDGVIFTLGCHTALNVADTYIANPNAEEQAALLDWSQAVLRNGGVFQGPTGYGIGEKSSLAFSGRPLLFG